MNEAQHDGTAQPYAIVTAKSNARDGPFQVWVNDPYYVDWTDVDDGPAILRGTCEAYIQVKATFDQLGDAVAYRDQLNERGSARD